MNKISAERFMQELERVSIFCGFMAEAFHFFSKSFRATAIHMDVLPVK